MTPGVRMCSGATPPPGSQRVTSAGTSLRKATTGGAMPSAAARREAISSVAAIDAQHLGAAVAQAQDEVLAAHPQRGSCGW